jgi:outer membrane protein
LKLAVETIYILFFALPWAGIFGVSATQAQSKIGYIDFQYLVSQVKSADDVQVELQKSASAWTMQIEAMKDSVANMEKDLETLSITLTKSSRDILVKRIGDEKQKIAIFQEQKFSPVSGELYKKQQELLQPIIDKIKKAIDNMRTKEKYDVIFDISVGNPVSIDKKFDLTLLVMDELTAVGLTVKDQGAGESQTITRDKIPVKTNSEKDMKNKNQEDANKKAPVKKDDQ